MRAMRQKNACVTFYEKAQNMRKMHKNRQITVDFMTDIRFEQGMDAREMKKLILARALEVYEDNLYMAHVSLEDEIKVHILDSDKLTDAQLARHNRVLQQMKDSARSKI